MTNHEHCLLGCLLNDGGLPVVHKNTFLCLLGGVVVAVVLEIGAPVCHRAIGTVIRIVGTDVPDFIAVRVIQIHLAGTSNGDAAIRHGTEAADGILNTVGRIIVVIVPGNTDVTAGQLVDAIPFGTDGKFLVQGVIADIGETGGGKQVADLVITVVQNNPFHTVLGISLGLEHLNCERDKLAAVVGGC